MMMGAETMIAILEAAGATGNPVNGAKVKLLKDDYFPLPTVTAAEMAAHEADFAGYVASAAIVWGQAYMKPTGQCVLPGSSVEFQPTDASNPNTIYGYWIESGASPNEKVCGVKRFDQPYGLSGPLDALVFIPEFTMEQGSS